MSWLSDTLKNVDNPSILGGGGVQGFFNKSTDPGGVHKYFDPLHLYPKDPTAADQILASISQMAGNAAQPYIQAYETGKLTDPQQAAVNQEVQGEKASYNQALASRGMGVSSSQVQAMNLAIQNGYNLTQKFLQDDFKNAMALLGVASGNLSALAALNVANDQATAEALSSAAQNLGTIMGQEDNPGGG